MNATLYNKNRPVLEVQIDNNIITKIGQVKSPSFLPLSLQHDLTKDNLNEWLKKRCIPETREGFKETRCLYGTSAFLDNHNMFSLMDQYWFRWNRNEKWDELNYFTNKYSSAPGQAFFAPWNVNKGDLEKPSPDRTTNGVLKKVWVQDENLDSYLIKAGSKKYEQEPISEILATMVLEQLNIIPIVHYDLCVYEMHICSKCKCFVTKDTEFVPAQYIYNKELRDKSRSTMMQHFIKMCKFYEIPNAEDYMNRMILADYIVGNTDRHLGNFGLLRDVNTGTFIGFSPLFDFGSAFSEFTERDDVNRKSHVFKSEEERIVYECRGYINVSALNEVDSLYRLIDLYPDLSTKQKRSIKQGIEDRLRRIGRIISGDFELSR